MPVEKACSVETEFISCVLLEIKIWSCYISQIYVYNCANACSTINSKSTVMQDREIKQKYSLLLAVEE
jgi:hypothetical protein